MYARIATVVTTFGILFPAVAGELKPEEAKRFVAGKLFSYTCFEGTTGVGRIHSDGSVAGTIQIRGVGPIRHVTLPSGTIKMNTDSICTSVRSMLFQPCFDVVKTGASSFRGSVSGFGFAYCDFNRRNPRLEVAHGAARPRPVQSAVVATSARE